jgi:TPR repeat protein
MKRFFIIPIIISLGFVLVSAGEFEEKLIKAEQRNANAQYDIGIMYKTGVGVPQNYKQAYIWFSLAAAQGNKDAAKKKKLD